MSIKISNETIGNRTRDLQTCSVLPDSITLCKRGEEDLIFGAAVTLRRP